jgi:hypothetical protein
MDGSLRCTPSKHEATVSTYILGVVLDDLSLQDHCSNFFCSDQIRRRIHSIKGVWQVKNTLSGSVLYCPQDLIGHWYIPLEDRVVQETEQPEAEAILARGLDFDNPMELRVSQGP